MPLKIETSKSTGLLACRGIKSSMLTTCEISRDGRAVRLHLLDHAGERTFLELPFDQAQSVVMTLPRLLTTALQTRMAASDARYVFPVDQWSLELGDIDSCLILTLRAEGGFEASFGLNFDMCRAIGEAMSSAQKTAAQSVPGNARRH
jgi:hypothetical protein